MLQVCIFDCSPLLDQQTLRRVLPLLTNARQEKVRRLESAQGKAQSAGAGLLLRHLFGDAEIQYGEFGKPYLTDNKDVHFSLSHSAQQVVCAVADSAVGVDIQPLSPIRPAVLKRCVTAEEQKWIGDSTERFTRLWTMKEAVVKMTGTGFSVSVKEIVLPIPPKDGFDVNNQCWWHLIEDGAPISICSRESHTINTINLTIEDLL